MIKTFTELDEAQKKKAITYFVVLIVSKIAANDMSPEHFPGNPDLFLNISKLRSEFLNSEEPWLFPSKLMTQFKNEITNLATSLAKDTGYYDNEFGGLLSISVITPKIKQPENMIILTKPGDLN